MSRPLHGSLGLAVDDAIRELLDRRKPTRPKKKQTKKERLVQIIDRRIVRSLNILLEENGPSTDRIGIENTIKRLTEESQLTP